MTWEKLYLRWRWEDTDSEEFLEELWELATFFPFINLWFEHGSFEPFSCM
jgi:hypothetical protein